MSGLKLLLVDDEPEFVDTLAERLRLRGYNPKVVYDGQPAIDYIKEKKGEVDVILLDLKMPGVDGVEVLRYVKKNYSGIKVFILTGHGSYEDQDGLEDLDADDYMQKPIVDFDLLLEKLEVVKEE